MADHQRLAEVRARLELPLLRRAAGLLEGRHRSIFKGHGQDFDDLSLYNPGDDIKDIDWKSSARAGIPIIRRFVRQSNLTLILAADTGRRMAALAASGTETKGDVISFAASIIAYIARDRGDRVALVAGDADRIAQRPPRASTQDLEALLHQLESMYRVEGPASDLDRVLHRVDDAFHRRSLLVLLTDESQPAAELLPVLRRLRVRHQILVISVADADPFNPVVAPQGTTVRDVDGTLQLPPFLQDNAELSRVVSVAARRAQESVQTVLRAADADGMITRGTETVLPDLIELLGRYRHASR
ncbi:Protein of unknown function DUF58 [Micrococcales bacterium KH10]|nr:Protein of unknown function DUF58 [Micrococcales bacterium KH10]